MLSPLYQPIQPPVIKVFMIYQFIKLGPGRPSAGGPRMDYRAVISLGVVKFSRLASRPRRSARRGPHILPRGCGPKLLLTRGPKRPFRCLDWKLEQTEISDKSKCKYLLTNWHVWVWKQMGAFKSFPPSFGQSPNRNLTWRENFISWENRIRFRKKRRNAWIKIRSNMIQNSNKWVENYFFRKASLIKWDRLLARTKLQNKDTM